MKILIIEDVVINIKLLEKILTNYGQCDSSRSGEDGIRTFKASLKTDNPYDLICLDIFMPGINGFEVLKQIRAIDSGPTRVKIIMTTSTAEKEDVIKAISFGCDGYLLKPYNKEDIESSLIKLGLYNPGKIEKEDQKKEGE